MEATRWQEVSSELEWKSSDCGGCCLLPLSVKLIREMFMNQPSTILCSAAPSFWWMYICRPAVLQLSRDMCVWVIRKMFMSGLLGGQRGPLVASTSTTTPLCLVTGLMI